MQTLLSETNPLIILFVVYGYIIYLLFFSHNPLMKWLDNKVKGTTNENDTRKAGSSNRSRRRRIK